MSSPAVADTNGLGWIVEICNLEPISQWGFSCSPIFPTSKFVGDEMKEFIESMLSKTSGSRILNRNIPVM